MDTVAQAGIEILADTRSPVPTPRRDMLVAWAAVRDADVWLSREFTSIAKLCVPDGVTGPIAAGPLCVGGRLVGVLLVGGASEKVRTAIQDVLEPFAMALENDTRLHELARLREAAEQDRTALLTRLARQDVSDAIIGSERGLREVMARVLQVAPTDAPVLILGETGAGKEVVARAVHVQSRRRSGPFQRLNCGAIPTELVDSELFGTSVSWPPSWSGRRSSGMVKASRSSRHSGWCRGFSFGRWAIRRRAGRRSRRRCGRHGAGSRGPLAPRPPWGPTPTR